MGSTERDNGVACVHSVNLRSEANGNRRDLPNQPESQTALRNRLIDEFYIKRNEAHMEKLLNHYEWIAKQDKVYAWKRVNELASQPLGFYAEFPEMLIARMKRGVYE